MATKKRATATSKKQSRKKEPEKLNRADLEKLIYGAGGSRRFTQDSPVLPDVWFEFGDRLTGKVDLLLNPHYEVPPGRVAQVVKERLEREEQSTAADTFPCYEQDGADIA